MKNLCYNLAVEIGQKDFDEIVDELISASFLYYQSASKTPNESPLSDEEYDLKLDYLQSLVESNPNLSTPDYLALVEKVASGTKIDEKSKKVIHQNPMLSLNKATTVGELNKFFSDTLQEGADENGWELQPKLDGVAISVKYENGKLKQIATRGDGRIGEDITEVIEQKLVIIQGLPKVIGILEGFEVRGEMVMLKNDFDDHKKRIVDYNQNEPKKMKSEPSNPRNTTAGILRRKENSDDEVILNFIVYSSSTLLSLEKEGFNLAATLMESELKKHNLVSKSKDQSELIKSIEKFAKIRQEKDFQLPTDGIVVKCVDDEKISQKMGMTAHHPKAQIAYKYPPEQKQTSISEIIVDVGRTGRLSFRAKFSQTLELDGSKVNFATLHNASWMQERNIRVGSEVMIVKANDIIPYVAAVLNNPKNSVEYVFPNACPECGEELDKRTLLWRCPNDLCNSRGIEALRTAVSRKYLNIDSLSVETLRDLWIAKKVRNLADIFSLSIEDLENTVLNEEDGIDESGKTQFKPRMRKATREDATNQEEIKRTLGNKTAITIYSSIQTAKSAPLEKVLAALNIPGLGLEISKNLVRHFQNINSIINATEDEFREVDLVSEVNAKRFVDGFRLRNSLIENMQKNGVEFRAENRKVDDVLEGETVVISGEIPGYNRDDAHDLIESLGAKTSSSVSSKTTILIADENSNSSKVQKAKELNITIILADDFIKKYVKNEKINEIKHKNEEKNNKAANNNEDVLANFML